MLPQAYKYFLILSPLITISFVKILLLTISQRTKFDLSILLSLPLAVPPPLGKWNSTFLESTALDSIHPTTKNKPLGRRAQWPLL